jgi:hypothetical protein
MFGKGSVLIDSYTANSTAETGEVGYFYWCKDRSKVL